MTMPPSTLIAVNGLGGLGHLWRRLAMALEPTFKLELLDLPGHGGRPPAADYHYDALAADVAERVSHHPSFPLLGWSVGAAVAWLVAARNPRRVTHLVLIEPAAPHQSPFRWGPVPEPVHPYTYASVESARRALGEIDPSITEEDVRAGYVQNAAGRWEPRFDPAIYPALVEDAWKRGDLIGMELAGVQCPVLVIRGERSFLTEAQARDLAGLAPDSSYATVRDAGHFIMKEKPDELGGLILDFVAGRSKPPRTGGSPC